MNGCPFRSAAYVLFALAVLALTAGCGDSALKTYPVTGKVVFKDKAGGVHRLKGGRVRFQSTSDPDLTAVGEIEDEGVFSLGALLKEKELSGGVPAGQYKARVEPPRDDEGKSRRGLIHPRYEDFDKSGLTFTVPVSGELVITVEGPGR
jgi:hypothetical protein